MESETALQLVDSAWGRQLRLALRRSPKTLCIVCPFITEDAVAGLLSDGSPEALRVITRFSLADFSRGVSDIAGLRLLLAAGARVRGVRHLHAKLYVFDSAAAVTSANLTMAALYRNHEFGCIVRAPGEVAACRVYFERLFEAAGGDLSADQLEDWDLELQRHLSRGAPPAAEQELPDHGAVVAGATPPWVQDDAEWISQAGQAHLKFFGKSNDRVEHSFPTYEEISRAHCHWACGYPRGARPRQVAEGDAVFMGRLAKRPVDTLIFGRAVARAHVDERDDASAAEIASKSWKASWPHYIRVHHAQFIAGRLANGISMNTMVSELGTDAFLTSQARERSGEPNVNPRRAVGQQPAVRLASEGFAWLNERFAEHLRRYGSVPQTQLDGLGWPDIDF